MAVKTESHVSILGHCLALDFFECLALSAAPDAGEPLPAVCCGLGTDFKSLESGAASVTDKTLRMEAFRESTECNNAAFNWKVALMAGCSCSAAYCR
jgi:hypothetical protein